MINVPELTTPQLLQLFDEIDFSKFRLTDLAQVANQHFGLAVPKSWNKAEIINLLTQAASGEDLSAYALKPTTPDYKSTEERLLEKSNMSKEEFLASVFPAKVPSAPATIPQAPAVVPELELATKVSTGKMSKAEVAKRLAEHKQTVADMQAEAELSKPKKLPPSKTYTLDQLVKFSDELGYAIGAIRWALGRITKIEAKFPELLDGLGELVDADASALATEATVGGYRRAHKQMRFQSPAHEMTLKQSDLPVALWREILDYRPENPVAALVTHVASLPPYAPHGEDGEDSGQ
jgi:hypothetical protein